MVLSLDREPWRSLEDAQRQTWARQQADVDLVYLRGIARGLPRAAFLLFRKITERLGMSGVLDRVTGSIGSRLPVKMHGGMIVTSTFEYWIGTSAKMRGGLRYAVDNLDFDYLVRTNSSTYVHLPSLLAHLDQAPRRGYYGGAFAGPEHAHAQGTLIILSHDVARQLSLDRAWNFATVDDVAVGDAAQRAGVTFQPLQQRVVDGSTTVEQMDLSDLSTNFVFRVKTRNHRLDDIRTLHRIHKRIIEG